MRRSWTDGEVEQVRELLVANPVEVVAKKIGRTPSSVKHLCSRVGIKAGNSDVICFRSPALRRRST
jgi:hypothetical protein